MGASRLRVKHGLLMSVAANAEWNVYSKTALVMTLVLLYGRVIDEKPLTF